MKSNRKKSISPLLAYSLSVSASEVSEAKVKMRATPEAVQYREEQEKLTDIILKATASAKTVEDLIYLEIALQEMDKDLAQTDQERGSISKAQSAYQELIHTVEQMRRAPEEYFRANLSISSQNIMKIPDVRGPMKIRSNLARLQNRAMFSAEEDRKVWDARIAAAHKTESMLKESHTEIMARIQKEKA